ncbi:hypothetical protein FA175_26740 [Pseudomonas aeruginosa]|uniref:DUF4279 domain-containing protein n=1 Tax=Pseudomonas aeruginosa TaxID=287 RepID=UPI0013C41A9C|nr:DUF4279 domain-containing protein [Pseudomonas aeruginosa]ELO2069703.1 hypothetical protein [Pseudomonas aeruginosa]MCO2414444.1 hypothetical protein [Pseudomonas aeruginosa]MCO3484152.1 hypothetical protein [Pseudomonas aeruginosa]WCX98274.1 hypothetical protein KK201_15180 [Pseudomonas aeruginosa]HBO1855781.1 hypothetical protein [Pseudomonas aeruginosa]
MNSSTYRLTFHIQHPTIPASEIEASLSFPTRISQSSGAHRKTKSGKILEGTYACTSIIFLLHRTPLKFEETPIEKKIEESIDKLDTDYLKTLANSGGKCSFIAGVYSDQNIAFSLDLRIIERLAADKIGVKFDFYGGPE